MLSIAGDKSLLPIDAGQGALSVIASGYRETLSEIADL